MKPACALDTSALLALIGKEEGAEVVASHLAGAAISAVSWSEVVMVLQNVGMTTSDINDIHTRLAISIIPFDKEQAVMASLLHRTTQPQKLSFGERACLALARTHNIPAITARQAWADIHVGVDVVLIR